MRSALLASLLLLSCTGEIIGDRPIDPTTPTKPVDPTSPTNPTTPTNPIDPDQPPSSAFSCTPGQEPSVTPLARLSVLQYKNSLRALFAPATGFDPLQVASTGLAKLPVDEVQLAFSNQDLRFSEAHLTGWYETADLLAQAAVATPAVLNALVGSCASQTTPTAACLNGFLDGFAKRVYRRPLTAEERTRYLALNDGSRDAKELFRALVFSLLMAPQFLYHPEVNGTGSGNVLTLDAFELASRLSFHFWQAPPDDALLAAAANGSLLTDAGYRAQLSRVVADPRTKTTMSQFYAEWFQLGRVSQFPTTPVFRAFAQGTTIGQTGADHLAAANAEIDALTTHFTWNTDGSLKDLLTTELSLTRSSHLASLYGVAPWDGTSPPPRMPAGTRSGLLTRVAMLTSGNHLTHPIHRGAVVRRRILCDELPLPTNLPPDALMLPPPSAQETTRQRFENKVRNEPCASCHRMMNPIGYVLEQYDAIGRHRSHETIFDESTGAVLNTLPVDSNAQPRVLFADDRATHSPAQLSQLVADSGRVEACFARQYFRFTTRRVETDADNCTLERLRVAAGPTGSLKQALEDVALAPAFRTRKVE